MSRSIVIGVTLVTASPVLLSYDVAAAAGNTLTRAYPLGTRTLCCQTTTAPRPGPPGWGPPPRSDVVAGAHGYGMPTWLLVVIIASVVALVAFSVREFYGPGGR